MPVSDDEDTRRAAVLREILDKILQFEKTPCPFERDFTVQLPERPTTPVKKRPWTPPVRTVSMNWPPQPVTPPPEFATRTRFYNPNARRHSDFGVDLSKNSATPETPEARPADGSSRFSTPTRPPSRRLLETMDTPRQETIPEEGGAEETKPEFGIKFRSVLEEPEPLTPPLTAIPPELVQQPVRKPVEPISDAPALGKKEPETTEDLEASPKASEPHRSLVVPKKREPIWITKKPSAATRKVQRPALPKAHSAEPAASLSSHSQGENTAETVGNSTLPEGSSNRDSSPVRDNTKRNDSTSSEEAGSIEGSGQMRLRRTRVAAFASRRAATAPALRLRTSTPAFNVQEEAPQQIPEPSSPAESSDSFHSTQSWHSPLAPPSPPMSPRRAYPYPHENIPLARTGDGSESAGTPTVSIWEKSSTGAVAGSGAGTPITPFYKDHSGEVEEGNKDDVKQSDEPERPAQAITITKSPVEEEDPEHLAAADTDSLSTSWSSAASRTSSPGSNTAMRHRAATTSVSISHTSPRALSPLPPPANLFTPRQGLRRLPSTAELSVRASTAVRTIRRIPSAILNKTCEMILGPPSHLINLMLKVAARIAAGEFRGFVFGMGEGGEVVDVRWDWSDEHSDIDEEGAALEGWDESDFDFGDDAARRRRLAQSRGRNRVRASFAAADLSRPVRAPGKAIAYQDPWDDEDEDPSRSWGVD